VRAAVVVRLGHGAFQRQHVGVEGRQLGCIHAADQAHQVVDAFLPGQVGGLHGLAVDGREHDGYAGSAQNTHFLRDTALAGPAPAFYFAPVQIKKRNADWSPEVVNQKFNAEQRAFIDRISDARQPWMQVQEHQGFAPAQALVQDLHAGCIDPQLGHVVVL
jgi:hypothetical protein